MKKNCKSLTEAYDFPYISPFASLSKPLEPGELKQLAAAIRKSIGSEKFNITNDDYTAFNEEMILYGPKLDILLPYSLLEICTKKIKTILSPAVIGTCLMPNAIEQKVRVRIEGSRTFSSSSCGSWLNTGFSFRAAAVANMYWQPIRTNGEIAYKWKIGKLCWLPKQFKSTS